MTQQTDYQALLRDLEAYRATDPLLFLKGVALTTPLTAHDLRFRRAEALQALAIRLRAAMTLCDFREKILVSQQGIFVDVGGVLMETANSNIYLKSSGVVSGNQGEALSEALRRMNIDVATAVDVGANYGEISLWLALQYPQARIVAIEPSSDNLSIFTLNKSVQSFPTDNIEIVQRGVTDKAGTATIPRGASTMTRVTEAAASANTEPVTCERLDVLFDRLGIRTADFVKIDIEGGEPKLKDAMIALRDRVRAYFIEFSQFAPFEDYMTLASALLSQGYVCRDETLSPLTTGEAIAGHLRQAFAGSNIAVANLWFVAQR